MPKSEGVSYYTTGYATIPVSFPEDMTTCQWCAFVRNEDSLKRHRCLLTDEYLPFPFTSRGNMCPIKFPAKESKPEQPKIIEKECELL